MAILMVFEMTLDYAIALPLMLACVAAYTTATAVYPESIYSASLRHKAREPAQPGSGSAAAAGR
jgi:CIC family chloride channel protein